MKTDKLAVESAPAASSRVSPVDQYLVFAFGVIFISVLLWLVFRTNQPLNLDQAKMVHLVSALAAGGVGAALPGTIRVRYRTLLRAGGAVALFVLVFVYQPGRAIAPPGTWPRTDPAKVVAHHLELIDAGEYERAYSELSEEGKKRFTQTEFVLAFDAGRRPFGEVAERSFGGVSSIAALPDGTPGHFKIYGYITKFKSGATVQEPIVAMANNEEVWGVLFHNVFPCPANQCAAANNASIPQTAASK